MIIVIPGTSKLAASRFPFTVRVEPTAANGLESPTVFLGFQVTAAMPDWVKGRYGTLEPEALERIEDELVKALGFDPPENEPGE